jgi:disulfide bond formation protein DsbB
MSRETVILFLALLTVATQVALVVGLALAASAKWRSELVASVGPIGLQGAAAVAMVAMLGSLYFSEVAHFLPCKLCWYQRIAMYPTAIVLVLAVLRRDSSIRPYVTALCGIGAVISTYHILVERFPNLESSTCDPSNPCSLKWVEKFGYLTIPVMALTGFIAVISLLAAHRTVERFASDSTVLETGPRIAVPPHASSGV